MAGHSKWANIRHRKGAQDAKRGKMFTKLSKEITVAAKEGGPDPLMNARLRLAISNAKGVSMPKDNIERAVKKATGADAANYEEVSYEGYGPNGIAVFVECQTDNTNRTVANVRSYFSKAGGSLGKNGSLEFLFQRKGVFYFALPEGMELEELELELIDAGAEELEQEENMITAYCAMEDFGTMQQKLEELNVEVESAELQRIPTTTSELADDDFVQVMKLIDKLEDDDDVQKVYHSLEVKEEQMELVG